MRRLVAFTIAAVLLTAACSSSSDSNAPSYGAKVTAPKSTDPAKAAAITDIVKKAMADYHLRAAITKVTIDGKEIVTDAQGVSMTGVPATRSMHFRNGAVAISYVATLLLKLVDEKKVSLDDKVSKWLPEIRDADRVTLGQLATMTSGYRDYVPDPGFQATLYSDPFRTWTPEELIAIGTSKPLWYEPGTNWSYAHTNYVILGLALEKITGKKINEALHEKVLDPLGLNNTNDPGTPFIQEPALHAFSSERREALGIPAGTHFYEESSFWNPSWAITRGAIETTDIEDMNTTAIGIGSGKLLSPESYRTMVSTHQRDFGGPVPGCPSCRRGDEKYTYGMGIVIRGHWLAQNPLMSGYAAVEGYLPSQKIAVSVAVTLDEAFFNDANAPSNPGDAVFQRIANYLAPNDQVPQ